MFRVCCWWLVVVLVVEWIGEVEGRVEAYSYGSYASIVDRMKAMEKLRPDLVKVYSAQAAFGLPFVGECKNEKGDVGMCEVWIADVTNFNTTKEVR